ncbi:peptidylprolyl isomerase [Marinicellulosiphila megalodicopiae]|uniref:peptidylprolyl isomerase n=1 Tax=Marinicellulosiphila megalodicopiae TaxID=2724896 RepID=UPI003BB0AAB2
MNKVLISLASVAVVVVAGLGITASVLNSQMSDQVVITTSKGVIVAKLDAQKAPKTVENFQFYVNESFYDGLIFHRVIKDFMVQVGGFDKEMNRKSPQQTVVNESIGGLSNLRGTLAMARTNAPDSASSQFFINHKDNLFLDGKENKPGYAVFGKVVEGMDVVDEIANAKTTVKKGMRDVPVDSIMIESVHFLSKLDVLLK